MQGNAPTDQAEQFAWNEREQKDTPHDPPTLLPDRAEQQMQTGNAGGQAEMQVRDRAEQVMQPGNNLEKTDARGRAEQQEKTHTITQSPTKQGAVARLVDFPIGNFIFKPLTEKCMQGPERPS